MSPAICNDKPDASALAQRLASLQQRMTITAPDRRVQLLAVSKLQSAQAMRDLHTLGQRAFGENYVQEAESKRHALADCSDIEWHLIGPLQSNKCREVAENFDWLQTLDRAKLIPLLARYRPLDQAPLNVLIQVNIDDEDSKSGVAPEAVAELAQAVSDEPRLRLRGIMSIPAPWPELAKRRASFERLRAMFEHLREQHSGIDTLSMGMSDDLELALAEGATMVRVGTAIFGSRAAP